MNEQEIKSRFESIEKRLDILEGKQSKESEIKDNKKEKFSGLVGGIRFLIKEGFLNSPKFVKEVWKKLGKNQYHYPLKSVEKLLNVNFRQNNNILTRLKEGKKWKYVVRK